MIIESLRQKLQKGFPAIHTAREKGQRSLRYMQKERI